MRRGPSRCGELSATAGLRPQGPGARPGLGQADSKSFVSNHDLNGSPGVIPLFRCGTAGAANTIHSLDLWCLARSSPPDGSNDARTHACRSRRRYGRPAHGRDSRPSAGGEACGARHRHFAAPGLAAAVICGPRTCGTFTYWLLANHGLACRSASGHLPGKSEPDLP